MTRGRPAGSAAKPLVVSILPPMHPDTGSYLREHVSYRVASDPSASTVMAEARRAVALIGRGGGYVGGEVYDALEDLAFLVASGSGADCFDVPGATERGIVVLNNPGRTVGVSEYVLTVIPLLSKRLLEHDRAMRRGEGWPPREHLDGHEISGRTIGVIGFGHLGQEVARRAIAAFDMCVLAYDPHVRPEVIEAVGATPAADIHTVLREADFVTVHVPLTERTRGLIGRGELEEMKPDAIFVNASRGAVVDEPALVDVLRSRRIAGAAIDVWDPEPPSAGHPLFGLDNVFVTPHMAGVTRESRAAAAKQIAETVVSALRGEQPTHVVNPGAWPPARFRYKPFPLARS